MKTLITFTALVFALCFSFNGLNAQSLSYSQVPLKKKPVTVNAVSSSSIFAVGHTIIDRNVTFIIRGLNPRARALMTWDFGNGDKMTTYDNPVTYTYLAPGTYNVKLTIKFPTGFTTVLYYTVVIP